MDRRLRLHQQIHVKEDRYDLYLEQDFELKWHAWILKNGKKFLPQDDSLFVVKQEGETKAEQEIHLFLYAKLGVHHACHEACSLWSRREI